MRVHYQQTTRDTINLYDMLLGDLLTVAGSTAEQPYNIIFAAVNYKIIYLFFYLEHRSRRSLGRPSQNFGKRLEAGKF